MSNIDNHITFLNEGGASPQWLAENYRIAALIAYGAILALNENGKCKQVLETIDKLLAPPAYKGMTE